MSSSEDKILIGNCSGFYGDRLSAAKDMVEGGPIDAVSYTHQTLPTIYSV